MMPGRRFSRLIGTDGNTDEGRIDSRGEALVFDLGTLKQQ